MTPGRPAVSIVVPAYNAGPYLRELCESIEAQTLQDFEVLLLDDASTDGTTAVLEDFRKDRRFRIQRWARNRGVHSATVALFGSVAADYWCHPGADDVLEPRFLERRLNLMESNLQAVMVHGASQVIDQSGKAVPNVSPGPELPPEMEGERALRAVLQHNIIGTSSILVRSHLTRLILPSFIGEWKYAQDWYFWILHLATGFNLLWDPDRLHKYRVHDQSLTTDPAKNAVRQAEVRLVPLCGLGAAARYSHLAARCWTELRAPLYRLWLRRAMQLHLKKQLRKEWLWLAASAFYGPTARPVGLYGETARHGPGMMLTAWRERAALQRQRFSVSGLAQIDDPVFR